MLVQMFWHTGTLAIRSDKQNPRNIWTINIFIDFLTTESQSLMRFPPQILLRGHGRNCPAHPPPPSPPGAAGPRNRDLFGMPRAAVLRLGSRGPKPSHRQNPTERRGAKLGENLGASKVEVLEIVTTQKSSLTLKNLTLWFWDVLMTSSWLKKAMWTRLAVKMLWGNLKNVPSLRKQICVRLGHNRIWNQSCAVDISCNRVRGLARILTGKKISSFDFWELQIMILWSCQAVLDYCTYHIRMDTLEPQKQFGLWWAWHSISRLNPWVKKAPTQSVGTIIVVFTNNNTKHWCKCLDTLSKQIKQYPPKSGTISEPSTSSFTSSRRNPKASWGFPTNILLRGHGPVCSVHPRPPSPPGAAGPRNRDLFGMPRAAVCCLGSRGPRASHRQNPTEWRGEIFQKFCAPQKSKFWKFWPLKNPPWT